MRLAFTKMNGAGNDFILIDNRDQSIELTTRQVQRLCDRNAGVGADGLMLLEPAQGNEAQWSWQFYNSDGSRAEMCGNGARCFAAFARRLKPCESLSFETDAGLIWAEFSDHRVCVDLTSPGPMTLNQPLDELGGAILVHSINTGVPHAVVIVDDLDEVDVTKLGAQVRNHEAFSPKGTNVNFVQPLDSTHIRVRTYERGVEGETLACGTGVSACALVMSQLHDMRSPIRVQVKSGAHLEVSFQRDGAGFDKLRLTGPADLAFTGTIDLD